MNLEDISIHAWIQRHNIKTEAGEPLDFRNHLFWYDVMNDMSPKQVWLKAAQMGGSTSAIIKTFWTMKRYGLDAIYTLPTSNDVKDFVGGKVNRIVANNPVLQEWVKDKDSVEQKRVNNNVIYYRGTWTERAALMVSSGLNVYDEKDRSKQDVIEQYASRQQHSDYKWEWSFSNPSVEGNGVSKDWQRSDQKHWFVRCSFCNERQYLSWPESIDQAKGCFVCKKCHKELTPEDRRRGEWVHKFKDKDYSGYWFSLLMAPWITAKEIVTLHDNKPEDYFYNFVLGLPYVGGGNKVLKNDILKNTTDETNPQDGRIIIGADTGVHIHYVVGNKKGIFFYGESDGYDDIEALLKRWPRSIVVFDQGGDLTAPRKLREKYRGRVFLCFYQQDRKTMELIRWGENEEDGKVLADRNRLIELVISEFKDGLIPLNGTEEEFYDYWLHWNNIYRTQEENMLGVIQRKWERSGADHWVHATVYWRIGMDKFGRSDEGKIITLEKTLNVKTAPTIKDGKMPQPAGLLQMPDSKNSSDWRNV